MHNLSGSTLLNTRLINETAAGDNSFGPFLKLPGQDSFDFTLLFEETILSIGPSALLLAIIPYRLFTLWKTQRKVLKSHLLTTKIALLATFSILQFVNVIEVSQSSFRSRASLAAALLASTAALGLCILSYIEHMKNIRPSSIINAYLLLTMPFDAAQLRSRWLRGNNQAENGIATTILAFKLFVLISEATDKTKILLPSHAGHSPESTSGLISRGLFWWLNPLFLLGYKGVVNGRDLFTADGDLLSKACEIRFSRYWANRSKYPRKHTLVWVMMQSMLQPLAASILPRLALTFFRFMQPLLINRITKLVSEPNSEAATNHGWGLTAATGLVYIGLALTEAAYQHKTRRMSTMVRGSLVTAIYSQTLAQSATRFDDSAALTLMSSDVERICDALLPIHNTWSAPLELGLAIWLLQKEIGVALVGPLIVPILAVSGPFLISKHMGNAQKIWLGKIQTRVDTIAKMVHAAKGVKMLGLSSKMSSIIQQLREFEIVSSLKMRKLFIAMIAFGNMSDIFAPGAAFIIYVIVASKNGQMLDVSSAFTALSLIDLMVAPIRSMVFAISPLIAAIGCFDRIEAYITSTRREDQRILPQSWRGHNSAPDTDGSNISATAIRVENLSLSWPDRDHPAIKDVSFDVHHGKLVAIVGPVGCGKSTLLRGLLGEVPISSGTVIVDQAHMSFVSQVPWIRNCSIRENIIGSSIFEPEWYTKVVHACALDMDVEASSEDDHRTVGTGGATLSGGQRLRVALARAVYSRHKIMLLDDVFSGLDNISEDRVFSRLLGEHGLLRCLGTTIIIVTHAAHRLPIADHIIALSPEGTISEQGLLNDLKMQSGYVSGLTARHQSTLVGSIEDPVSMKARMNDEASQKIASDDIRRPIGNWKTYTYYFTSLGWGNVGLWVAMTLLHNISLQFPNLWIKLWTGAIALHGNSVNGIYLGVLLAVEIAAMITLMMLTIMLFLKMIPRSAKYLHQKLLWTVENAPLSFLTSTDTGEIINRFSNDLSVIDSELPVAGLIVVNNIFASIVQAAFVCISASYFAIVIPFVLFSMYLLQKFYLQTSRQIRLMDLEAKAPLYSDFIEALSGLITIRAFGWNQNMKAQNMTLLDASQRPFYLLYCIQIWLMLAIDLMIAVLAVVLVALIVALRHKTDAGFVGLALVNIMAFHMTLSAVIIHWTATETSLGAISRIKSFVESTEPEHRHEENQDVPVDWPFKGELLISNVSASYAVNQAPTLQGISLSIAAGQKVGICGVSGAGKSSLIALILRMMEVSEGSIEIDGMDVLTIPRNVLRERFMVIPQEPIFLKGSIRQNVDPLELAGGDQAIETVLKRVGLWSTVTNAGGLDMPMDADELLSHGQRQLFCLARAMLRRSSILMIDEASASVDLHTDSLMQQIILDHFAGCTIIAVAHRLQTIRHFDRIAVIENGAIVEYGEPDYLLAYEGGKFRALWDS